MTHKPFLYALRGTQLLIEAIRLASFLSRNSAKDQGETKMNIKPALIDYFRKGVRTMDKSDAVDFAAINKKSVRFGYVIHPDCCNKFVDAWLDTLTANHNATFYKEWTDVISKNRFELLIDQIRHYASTYGTSFTEGNGYVPNDGSVKVAFDDMKVLEPIDLGELATKCQSVLQSGIALKDATMKVLADFVYDFIAGAENDRRTVSRFLSSIKNKEAQCYLSTRFSILPEDEFGMLRCIVHAYTGNCMLIKSKATVGTIKAAAHRVNPLVSMTDSQIKTLSKIFFRFKPLFLAMKTAKTSKVINAMRRMAEKNHTPFHAGFWETIVKTPRPASDVANRLSDLDNFRKIRLMMLIKEKLNTETTSGVFVIRNGRTWVREDYKPKYDKNWLNRLYYPIEESLVSSLKAKACKVKFPEYYDIALPTSEKTFVGNFPYGTSFALAKDNVIGIYWRNEWGTHDFDLNYTDLNGNRIAWNTGFYNGNQSVVHSGDMTNADPDAAELLFIEDSAPDGIVKNNRYNGREGSKFRFFFATEKCPKSNFRGHMVNPNNIKFDTMLVSEDDCEQTIGMVIDNRFFLMDVKSGKRIVSRSGSFSRTIIENMRCKTKGFIGLKEILLRAGFEIAEEGEKPEIDFTNLEKDTIINLLSK